MCTNIEDHYSVLFVVAEDWGQPEAWQRAQVSDGAATPSHCRATGRQPYIEHKVKLCVLLENKPHLQDVSSEKVACRVCV